MVVQWTTAETGSPVVMYGKSASASTDTVQAMTKTYNASDFCGVSVTWQTEVKRHAKVKLS